MDPAAFFISNSSTPRSLQANCSLSREDWASVFTAIQCCTLCLLHPSTAVFVPRGLWHHQPSQSPCVCRFELLPCSESISGIVTSLPFPEVSLCMLSADWVGTSNPSRVQRTYLHPSCLHHIVIVQCLDSDSQTGSFFAAYSYAILVFLCQHLFLEKNLQ